MSTTKAAKALLEALDAAKIDNKDVQGLADELRNNIVVEESKLPEADSSETKAALVEVRDLLHKGWVEEAKQYLEAFLNGDETLGRPMTPLPYISAFESAFRTACRKHNLIAAYAIVETDAIEGEPDKRKYRIITGGMHLADAVLSYHLKPLADSLGQNIGPKKSFLDIQKIEQRAPVHIK